MIVTVAVSHPGGVAESQVVSVTIAVPVNVGAASKTTWPAMIDTVPP